MIYENIAKYNVSEHESRGDGGVVISKINT